jgi:hypothetical protein
MVVAKLGMKTYLIEDHMLNHHDVEIKADHRGKYEDFYAFVQALPNIN